nr:hypothetical protein [Tanacetum cinerariifolium]
MIKKNSMKENVTGEPFFTSSGKVFGQWELITGSGNALSILFLTTAAADLDEIEEVNANYGSTKVHNYENCDDNEIFNMFPQEEQYTEILEPIPESHQVPQNDNNVISEVTSVEQSRETVEQHPANVEETHALYDSLYQNLAIEVQKVNTVNRKLKETNAELTTELARFKNQEKCFEISQEKYDKLERCYQQSIYQEQCLSKKINALHSSSDKQIMTLNEEISDLNKQLSKEKSTVSFLLKEKKKLKSDIKIREDELLDKQIQLEKKIKKLDNILVKMGQSIQTIHMLSPKPYSFYHTEQKMALGYQNPFYLKQAQKKQQSLYDGKVLLEKHDPPVVHDSEETLQFAQESHQKMKQMNKEIKPANYTKINHLSGVFISQMAKSREELYFSNISKTTNVSKLISIPNEEFLDDTTPSVARKFLNEVKSTIVTLQRVVKHRMSLETHNWSSPAHQELHKIVKDEIFPIVNQVDARVQNFEIQILKEAAKFVGDFKSLAKELDESLAKHKALELEIERLLRAVISQDIMSIVQKASVVDTSNLQTKLERTKERFENCIIKKENEYTKLWNDWYKKCEECKFDKISYGKAYNDMQQKIKRLQALFRDLKGKSKDTSCVSNTRNPLSQKLENENVELEFQVLIYAKENAHLKTTYKNLFDFISVSHNTKTRRPQPRRNTKNDRVSSSSKSSRSKNKEVKVQEHHRNLLLSKNKKHMSSACNNIKLDSHNVISKVVCTMCKQCLIFVNHDVCLRNYVNGKTSRGKKQKANVSIKEKQKKHQPKVKKTKKVGFIERLATPKPSKPRFFLRWSPTGRLFDLKGKINESSKSESQYDCSNGDNACTFNTLEPKIKRFPNSTSLLGRLSKFVYGLPKFKYHKEHLCPLCEQGKSKIASHPPKPVLNLRQKLHLLHMDLCGPMRIASINGKQYVLVIVDDYSRYTWVHFLRSKDEAPKVIKTFLKRITVLFQVVERRNRTLVEAARTMLIFSRAPLFLWAEAIATACFTQNRSIIHRHFNKTPYELINGKKLDISFLHVFGALCYPKNDRKDIGKLGAKDSAPTPTNSSSQATNLPISSQEVDELNSQQQHAQQQGNQAHLQSKTVADNVQNAMFDGNSFVNPFSNPSTSAAESSSSQNVDPLNMHTFYQPYPHEFQ